MQRRAASKEGLRQAIARRQARVDEQGDFTNNEQMTPHEKVKKERRKEQNRRAAQRCRFKKRQNQTKVLQTFQNILDSNRDLSKEMQNLKQERDKLRMTWSSHCRSCPLFSPSPIKTEMPCDVQGNVIKTEEPSSIHDVISGIKQETPPLSDCMVMAANYPANVDDDNIFSSFPEYRYPHNDHHYTPPPQYYQHHHFHLHHHHEQQQQQKQQQQRQTINSDPIHPIPPVYPYPPPNSVQQLPISHQSPNDLFLGPSENRPLCPPTPVSPSSNSPVPYHNQYTTQQHHMNIHPNAYDYAHNSNSNNSYQPKLHSCSSDDNSSNNSSSPQTSSSFISKGSSSTTASKYPDLCRHLQRTPSTTSKHNVPLGNRYIPQTTPSPGGGNTGAVCQTQPPYSRATVTINHLPNPKPENTLLPQTADCTGATDNRDARCASNSPAGAAQTIIQNGDMSSSPSSTVFPTSPLCRYNNMGEGRRGDRSRSNSANVSSDMGGSDVYGDTESNPGPLSISESLCSTSDMETESVISTALDMETAYTLSRDKCIGFDTPDRDDISSFDEFRQENDAVVAYSVGLNGVQSSPVPSNSGERAEEENCTDTQPLIADDLSDIPNKELLFFPSQAFEG